MFEKLTVAITKMISITRITLISSIGRVRLRPSGDAEKIEVVSVCLRSAAKSRKRRCGVCSCVKEYAKLLCCVKTLPLPLRCVTKCWKPAVRLQLHAAQKCEWLSSGFYHLAVIVLAHHQAKLCFEFD